MSWTCIRCGAVERLHIFPDCCSSCGGAMTSEDGRSTAAAGSGPEIPFEIHSAAADGDRAAVVELWQLGAPACTYRRDAIDDLLLLNRVDMLMAVFGSAQEAA